MEIRLVRAGMADAELIFQIQKEAFAGLLAKYQDMDTNPGNEPLEKTVMRLGQESTYFYLIQLAEEIHGTENWMLSTILQEKGNCHLYEKMGYHQTGETKPVNDKLTLVFYEK